MKFPGRPQTLLEDRRYSGSSSLPRSKGLSISARRGVWLFLVKPLALVLTLLSSAEVFAEPIKAAYAALSGTQVAVWMAKEGGYLAKYGIEADLIYIPAVAATQALIAGEIQLAQVTGVSTSGAILAVAGGRIAGSSPHPRGGPVCARAGSKTPGEVTAKRLR